MSTMVVRELLSTQTLQVNSTVKKNESAELLSTITPFEKLLEEETQKTTSVEPEKVSLEESKKTKDATSKDVTLKDIFERASEKYNISYDFLVAVAKAESNFNEDSVSSAGAQGMMQLMPETAKDLGVEDPFDPEESIMAAARLLKAHLKKFQGDYTLAAAAYNAGSGRVLQYGGVPPFEETQNYVKKIKAYMEEGVEVPERKVSVSKTFSSEGSGGSAFDEGVAATKADLENVSVVVGKGDSAITMTYGAYLKYLELGTTGVG